MEKSPFQCFRLRLNEQIVGYLRYISPSKLYYSKDRFWWQATSIDYNIKDCFVDKHDINQQWLFENDIVECSLLDKSQESFKAVILYNYTDNVFTAVDCEHFNAIPQEKWNLYRFKIISYLFINKPLQHLLMEEGWIHD